MSAAVALSPEPVVRSIPRQAGVSDEARDLVQSSDVLDLHLDTFIAKRLLKYDIFKRHKGGPLGRHFMFQVDLPRLKEGGVTGGMWSITTNPFRSAASRWAVFEKNLQSFRGLVDGSRGQLRFVRDVAEYRAAVAAGAHAVLLSVQGGHAFEAAPNGVGSVTDRLLTRVTVVHLLSSAYGATSSPLPSLYKGTRLSPLGEAFVRDLNANRVFVDLAHIHPDAFWDAVRVHDKSQPLIVTHTGVTGVTPHWRNLDDRQIKAVADTGGTIGIIFEPNFLRRSGGPTDGRMLVEHIQHVIKVAGDDFVSLGSDYDGMISPPADIASIACIPLLVQYLLDAGIKPESVRKILGGNALRAFGLLRPA